MNFDIRVDPAAARFVVRGFFTPREFPQALARALFTREFVFTALVPAALAVASHWRWKVLLLAAAGIWLLVAFVWMLRAGRKVGIGCFADGRLVGGLLLKVRPDRIRLSGVLIAPEFRGQGIFPALLLAAFRMASPGTTVAVFGTAHPASKHVVERYFHGHRSILVDPAPDSLFSCTLATLLREVDPTRFTVTISTA